MNVQRLTSFLLFIAVVTLNTPCQAQEWWNDQWMYRKKITFDTTAASADIADNQSEVPILLRLHTGNFNFGNAKENGDDIRFVGSDNTTLLKHHIEKYDTIDEMGFIWVKIPRLSGNFDKDFVFMYYGNESAMGGQDAKGTWDINQAVVYHFGEVEGAPQDATAYANHAASYSVGQGLPAVIGNGASFSGMDQIVIPASPSTEFKDGFTFSSWIRLSQPVEEGYIFAREEADRFMTLAVNGSAVCFRIQTSEGELFTTQECMDIGLESWHHLAVTVKPNDRITLFLDGLEMFYAAFPKALPAFGSDTYLGASSAGDHYFIGELDETRMSGVARPLPWIRTAYKNQGPDSVLLSFGEEVMGGGSGMPVFYLATVFKNITLDGWFVIILLVLLSLASWVVMINKAFTLRIMRKDNDAFEDSYRSSSDPVALSTKEEDFSSSPLFNIYRRGCRELNGLNPKDDSNSENRPSSLSPQLMERLKVALDRGYMEESRRMNKGLVLLTMAISGGPFLGLLGTVWGVMNTFAALAEAGEANIMAIAPGVASALSTTVFGLIVAIPALFGYNFLSAQIKNFMAEMMVFADQFPLQITEKYGQER